MTWEEISKELFEKRTAKRFTLNSVLNFDFGICDYGEPIGSLRNISELLNELHEENQRLKKQIKELNLKMTRDLNDFLRK